VRRACRRSELRAARWLEASAPRTSGGFASTTCVALDATKVVSGDGSCVRVWSHGSGRRIATLTGHPGRLSAVCFDEETLISGCTGGVVRLWSMDELRCTRSLRHHAGAVTAVALLHGVPISAGEEGEICFWDAAASAGGGAPILSFAAGGLVAALDASSPAGHLVSAGWDVDCWDLNSAERLCSMVAPARAGDESMGTAGGGFSCVAASGSLVAAGRAGEVVLWDVRSARCVGTIAYGGGAGCGGVACGEGTLKSAAGAAGEEEDGAAPLSGRSGGGSGGGAGGGAAAPCVGVQLDDWKLLTGWSTSRSLCVYDVRSLGGSQPRTSWQQPVMTLETSARVTCFKVRVLVGWGWVIRGVGSVLLWDLHCAQLCITPFAAQQAMYSLTHPRAIPHQITVP